MNQNVVELKPYDDPDDYDEFLSTSSLKAKILCRIAWGFKDFSHAPDLLKDLSDDFDGTLLDVPAGSGLFTREKYSRLKKAKITCVDYSQNMLDKAERVFKEASINNVDFIQGDVGDLKFEDNSFDIVVSMNGFHVFPDKEKAFYEILRVLKPGGLLIGCSYVRNVRKITDKFVDGYFVPKCLFTPPFHSKEEFYDMLVKNYSKVNLEMVGAVACYHCLK
ncbi:class I SAM-dependent methyltransferase [Ruminiclostridium josui]|uniref:class I SAM-dependent methyltransferase n=1 Tax=Ruminiclostridium josui TaxID=1499 RepID=UPI000466A02C|nr:class I SAM-dependent methyltransferase [Ruminiclostridium josui]